MSTPDGPGYRGPQQQPYAPPQYPQQHGQQWGPAPAPAAPARRRRVWPWVLLGALLVPILGFAACTAMLGGAISAVDQQREGGTVALGETFTYQSGLAITAAPPTPFRVDNQFIVKPGVEQAFESLVTVVNGTQEPVGAVVITMNATVGTVGAERVFDEASLPTQDIAPGQTLQIPFRFKVAKGTTGPLQIAISGAFNKPVFFTGQLG